MKTTVGLFSSPADARAAATRLRAIGIPDDRAEDEAQDDAARRELREAGAEDLDDAARERWWIGLRSVEAEQYREAGGDFARDEARYRLGFEAALRQSTRGRGSDDVVEYLGEQYPDAYRDPAFRRGFERGRAYEHGSRRAA